MIVMFNVPVRTLENNLHTVVRTHVRSFVWIYFSSDLDFFKNTLWTTVAHYSIRSLIESIVEKHTQ